MPPASPLADPDHDAIEAVLGRVETLLDPAVGGGFAASPQDASWVSTTPSRTSPRNAATEAGSRSGAPIAQVT